MSVELVITVRDEEKKRLTQEFVLYERFEFIDTDPTINKCVKELLEEFKGTPDVIKVTATMIMR